MFGSEFFPTPKNVIEIMTEGMQLQGKTILEPSAGKGDIVDFCAGSGATVLGCEINKDLQKIISPKCKIIAEDFFKVTKEDVSHIHTILMNPPFSNASKHILHAWHIAPEGCEIVSLCNFSTIDEDRYGNSSKRELEAVIRDYGDDSINLGSCFDTAERKTNVEVGMIKLFKPIVSSGADWDGFYLQEDAEAQSNGIMPYNEIRSIVNSYLAAVNCFDRFKEISSEMNSYTSTVGFGGGFSFYVEYNKSVSTKEEFSKEMQKKCWSYVFKKMKLEKYVTSGVMQDINRFVETRSKYPFSMKNIYKMFEIIVGTKENTMKRAIEEAVDNMTKHTHENRFNVEGWKTNSGYCLNKKFIVNWIVQKGYGGGMELKYSSNATQINDLTKALCYLTAINFDDVTTLERFFQNWKGKIETNKWYSCGFFEFKCFLKGTMHFKFQDNKDWEVLNRTYAKIKGNVLPENI